MKKQTNAGELHLKKITIQNLEHLAKTELEKVKGGTGNPQVRCTIIPVICY